MYIRITDPKIIENIDCFQIKQTGKTIMKLLLFITSIFNHILFYFSCVRLQLRRLFSCRRAVITIRFPID